MQAKLIVSLELVAQGDTAILATTGYGLRNDIVHNQGSDPLPAPDNFQVTQGAISGTLGVSCLAQVRMMCRSIWVTLR